MEPQSQPRKPIGEWLVAEGLISQGQLLEALANRIVVEGQRERLGETIARLGFVDMEVVSETLAKQFGVAYMGSTMPEPAPDAAGLVEESLARTHRIVPLGSDADGTLVLLTADPSDGQAIDEARVSAGAPAVRPIVTSPTRVSEALARVYTVTARSRTRAAAPSPARADRPHAAPPRSPDGIVSHVIDGALALDATSVHLEPVRAGTRIRMRVDGVLRESLVLDPAQSAAVLPRLRRLLGLPASGSDGAPGMSCIRHEGPRGAVELVGQTWPHLHGQRLVITIRRLSAAARTVNQIGLSDQQQDVLLAHVERPQGLCLLVGPTGSGITSTLYALVAHLSDEQRNVMTIEKPVESELPGVNQTPLDPASGFTAAAALQLVVDQDADVVMVDRLQDGTTAREAFRAAASGRMVLSSVHGHDAADGISVLLELGLSERLIASGLTMVVAQRLARRVCQTCAAPYQPTGAETDRLGMSGSDMAFSGWVQGRGCEDCGNTGYRGRVALVEILSVTDDVAQAIRSGADHDQVLVAARRGGLRTLRQDGMAKARGGVTTLEEVLRTTAPTPPGQGDATQAPLAEMPRRVTRATQQPKVHNPGPLAPTAGGVGTGIR